MYLTKRNVADSKFVPEPLRCLLSLYNWNAAAMFIVVLSQDMSDSFFSTFVANLRGIFRL